MHDIRNALPFTDEEINFLVGEVNRIRKRINETGEDDPAGLSLKIDLYIDLQYVVGELHSQAVYNRTEAYFKRKNEYHIALETAYGYTSEAAKKAEAERRTLPELQAEGKAKALEERWEQMFKNCEQKANSLKKRLENMQLEMYGPRGGRN